MPNFAEVVAGLLSGFMLRLLGAVFVKDRRDDVFYGGLKSQQRRLSLDTDSIWVGSVSEVGFS